ncbi:MAG: archaellin/type IV pilin N-terminal domain-containing protein [Candidatus Bathyarchaeia archaeon]
MAKKLLKTKKAISPILATLLLIVIAVAAIVVTYAWIMTYMSSAGTQAGVILYKENISWNSTANKTYITIGNSGTSNTKIVRLYLGTSQGNLINVTANTDIDGGIVLNAKSAATITLDWPNAAASDWTPGNYYYFKVITETGQELPFPEQAPTS